MSDLTPAEYIASRRKHLNKELALYGARLEASTNNIEIHKQKITIAEQEIIDTQNLIMTTKNSLAEIEQIRKELKL